MKKKIALFMLIISLSISGCGNHHGSTMVTTPNEKESVAAASIPTSTPSVPVIQKKSKVFFHASITEKKVALTFDDGPDDKYTPRILDILKNDHIHATFFLIGEHAEQYPSIVKRIVEEGHTIGNHTWDHHDLTKLSKEQINEELTKTDEVISKVIGSSPTLFRAPYGAVNPDVMTVANARGHQTIGWSVDTMDWDGKTVLGILHNVRKEIRPGAIILMHSAGGKGGHLDHTVEALPKIIHDLQQQGYSFVPVTELLEQ